MAAGEGVAGLGRWLSGVSPWSIKRNSVGSHFRATSMIVWVRRVKKHSVFKGHQAILVF